MYRTDALPLFRGHQILPDVGIAGAAPTQLIQLGIKLIGLGIELALIKIRLIPVQLHIGTAAVIRQVLHGINGILLILGRLRPLLAVSGRHGAPGKQQKQQAEQRRRNPMYIR